MGILTARRFPILTMATWTEPTVFGTAAGINETIVADKCADVALSMRVRSLYCIEGAFIAGATGFRCFAMVQSATELLVKYFHAKSA